MFWIQSIAVEMNVKRNKKVTKKNKYSAVQRYIFKAHDKH